MGHTDQQELNKLLIEARKIIEVGVLYKHYKSDDLYRVMALALDEETQQPCVIYQGLYGQGITWIRPVEVFLQSIEYEGKKVKRFTKVE